MAMKDPFSLAELIEAELIEAVKLAAVAITRDGGERLAQRGWPKRRQPKGTRLKDNPSVGGGFNNEPIPTEPNLPAGRACFIGCILHRSATPNGTYREVHVDGCHVRALLDTGSSVSLVQPSLLHGRISEKPLVPITCVLRDTCYVPSASIIVAAEPGSWCLEVGVVKELPVPLRLGRPVETDFLAPLRCPRPEEKADDRNLDTAPSPHSWSWKVREKVSPGISQKFSMSYSNR